MVVALQLIFLVLLRTVNVAPFPTAQKYNDKSPYFFAPVSENSNRFACSSESNNVAPRCNTKKNYRTGSLFDDGSKQSDEEKTKSYMKQYKRAKAKGMSVEKMELTFAPPHFPLLDERDESRYHDIGCRLLTDRLFFDLKKLHNLTVLDVGCGFGTFTRCIVERFGSGRIGKVVGISMSRAELNAAKQIMKDWGALHKGQYEYRIVDMNELGKTFEPNTFDLVFNRESFIYANSPETYLKSVYSILKPGGTLRMVAGFLRRGKLTFTEGKMLERLYGNDYIMGKDNPCCVIPVSEMRQYLISAGYNFNTIEDLSPYTKPYLLGVLKEFYESKPSNDFEVNFAKSALGGLLSLFFVSGTKAHDIDFFEHRKATIGNGNNLLRHGN